MKAYVIQVGSQYVNWQNLLVDKLEWSVAFTLKTEAETVAAGYENAQVVPHEITDISSNVQHGTCHEYHESINRAKNR